MLINTPGTYTLTEEPSSGIAVKALSTVYFKGTQIVGTEFVTPNGPLQSVIVNTTSNVMVFNVSKHNITKPNNTYSNATKVILYCECPDLTLGPNVRELVVADNLLELPFIPATVTSVRVSVNNYKKLGENYCGKLIIWCMEGNIIENLTSVASAEITIAFTRKIASSNTNITINSSRKIKSLTLLGPYKSIIINAPVDNLLIDNSSMNSSMMISKLVILDAHTITLLDIGSPSIKVTKFKNLKFGYTNISSLDIHMDAGKELTHNMGGHNSVSYSINGGFTLRDVLYLSITLRYINHVIGPVKIYLGNQKISYRPL